MMKVLVTNGGYKNALCAIRTLGQQKDVQVSVLTHSRWSVGALSKYAKKVHIISTERTKEEFIDTLISILKEEQYDVLLPIGYPQTAWIAEYQAPIKALTHLSIAPFSTFEHLQDKRQVHALAEKLHLPTPKTWQELPSEADCVFPLVLKYPLEGTIKEVLYIHDYATLLQKYAFLKQKYPEYSPIIQQYLGGKGAGFFALYHKGRCVQYFMHERVREYPVSGGASSCAKSIFDEQLLQIGTTLLDAAEWHGVAMVEFKYDHKGNPYILEVNPKFWGSLDLSIHSGVDFITETCWQALLGDNYVHEARQYTTNIRFSWALNGDWQHGIEQKKLWTIFQEGFQKDTYTDWHFKDFLPTLFQFLRFLVKK